MEACSKLPEDVHLLLGVAGYGAQQFPAAGPVWRGGAVEWHWLREKIATSLLSRNLWVSNGSSLVAASPTPLPHRKVDL